MRYYVVAGGGGKAEMYECSETQIFMYFLCNYDAFHDMAGGNVVVV